MAPPRFGLDTNILVYAADSRDRKRQERAILVVDRAARTGRCVLALQTIGEFFHAATRKRVIDRREAAARAADYMAVFETLDPASGDARQALAAAADGRYSYWDALLLTVLARGGCAVVLSEDMQDGAALAGTMVRNPFANENLPNDIDELLGISLS